MITKHPKFQLFTQTLGILTLIALAAYGMVAVLSRTTNLAFADELIGVAVEREPHPDDHDPDHADDHHHEGDHTHDDTPGDQPANPILPESERKTVNLSSIPDPDKLETFNYTGILRNTDGTLVNGTRNIRIAIYEDPVGGVAQYEEAFSNVNVREGQFSVVLGDNPITGDLLTTFETAPLYIALSTDGGSTYIIPRERVHGVPWAISALNAYDGVPVGGIIDFWWPVGSLTVPNELLDGSAGWLLCNGQLVDDVSSPLDGYYLPNLTNRFTRGTDTQAYIGFVGGSTNYYTTWDGAHDHVAWRVKEGNVVSDGAETFNLNWGTNEVGVTGNGNTVVPGSTADQVRDLYTDWESNHRHNVNVTPPHMEVFKLCRTR